MAKDNDGLRLDDIVIDRPPIFNKQGSIKSDVTDVHECCEHTHFETDDELSKLVDVEVKRLRKYLKLYFQPAIKISTRKCTIHVFYCILFLVHLSELTLMSFQMFKFGEQRSHFGDMINKEKITLHNLLLEGWDSEWEVPPYPPSRGAFAVYNKKGIEKKINYAIERYLTIEQESLGYFYTNYNGKRVKGVMKTFDFTLGDGHLDKMEVHEKTFYASYETTYDESGTLRYNITEDFILNDVDTSWNYFLSLTLSFNVSSIKFFIDVEEALCIFSKIKLTFDDPDNVGQVLVTLDIQSEKMECTELGAFVHDWSLKGNILGIGIVVIVASSIGLFCTLCTFLYGIAVLVKTKRFMRKFFKYYFHPDDPTESDLPNGEYLRFVSIWNICIILSEVFTLYGTTNIIFKGEGRTIGLDDLDTFMIVLGVGCFLAWISCLRVVRFHRKFRLLLSTVWLAASDVFAYLLCVGIMFIGYFIVGYVVLGPYNIKFSTPTTCLETLSALVNGDEIYTTLSLMDVEDHGVIWWFSRVYMWSYIAAFTIIVLNLLIAIFMSAYDAIKNKETQRDLDPDFGPLEVALRDFLETETKNEFRKSLHELMTSSKKYNSDEEQALKSHLCHVCTVTADGKDVVLKHQRTLKAVMREDNEDVAFSCCGIDYAFITVFKNIKNNFDITSSV